MLVHASCGEAPDGGAVELSWALREHSQGFVGCEVDGNRAGAHDNDVMFIELEWTVERDGVVEVGSDTWPCNNNDERHGVTEFEVPEGDASLAVFPKCSDGQRAAAATYRAPAPIRRGVKRGEIVTLGALVIEIERDFTSVGEPPVRIPGICCTLDATQDSTSPCYEPTFEPATAATSGARPALAPILRKQSASEQKLRTHVESGSR
jgi:hypothetical protein